MKYLTIEYSVLEIFKPFLLGYCNCGCGGQLKCLDYGRGPVKYLYSHGVKLYNKPSGKDGKMKNGYVRVYDPTSDKKDKRVYKHRKIMEGILGRKLRRGEEIHHLDKDPENNDPSNLILTVSNLHGTLYHVDDKSDWFCLECGTKTTSHYYNKYGTKIYKWYKCLNGRLCNRCYERKRITKKILVNKI